MTEAGPEPAPGFLRRHRRHLGIAGTGTLLLIIGLLLPAAAVSFLREIRGPGSAQTQNLTEAGPLTVDSGGSLRLQITLDSFAPWDGNLRLHISGHRSCATVCTPLRVLFVSIPARTGQAVVPTTETVAFAAGVADVSQTFTLPVEGEWIDYPFDSYRLVLGLVEQRVRPDGSVEQVSSAEATTDMSVAVQERLSDIELLPPRRLDPQSVMPIERDYAYALVAELNLRRPFYEQGATTAVILLAVAAAAYGVFMRPFRELAIGATGLTLSLWGVRSLLMGQQPGITTVDVILISVIVFVLCGITARVLIALVRGREAE